MRCGSFLPEICCHGDSRCIPEQVIFLVNWTMASQLRRHGVPGVPLTPDLSLSVSLIQMSARRCRRRPSPSGWTRTCPECPAGSPTSTWTWGTDACSSSCWRSCRGRGWWVPSLSVLLFWKRSCYSFSPLNWRRSWAEKQVKGAVRHFSSSSCSFDPFWFQ